MGGQRYLSLYVGFSNVNDLKLEFTNYANNYRDILLDSNYIVPTEEWINITFTSDGKNGSLYVTHFLPTIRFPSSISSMRSTNKNGLL